jgi:branched-chain amino acid transport system permease protein
MTLFLQQLANGIALGSVYGLIAIGFTLIFGVLRLLNMAHGSISTVGAYFAYGGIVLLGASPWLAILAAIALVMAGSLGIEQLAFRPLRGAPHFIPLVSTVAVSTILLELIRLGFGSYMVGVDPLIAGHRLNLGPIHVSLQQLLILGISLVLMVAVQLLLKRTQWGKAVRATSQDLVMGQLLGINVDRVVGGTFALGSGLGAAAGILTAMQIGALYPDMGFVALVKSFTAAILGGMGSVPGAVAGGFILGIAESLGAGYLPAGFSDAVPYLLLFVVLLFMPGGLTGARSRFQEAHSFSRSEAGLLDRLLNGLASRHPAVPAGLLLLVTIAASFVLGDYALRIMIIIALYAMAALGTNLVLGLAGQLSLSHAGFFAIGAYASAILTTRAGLDFWGALASGALIAFILGIAVSFVTFRVQGYYLALVTLAFAELVRIVISYWINLTHGMMGIRAIPSPTLFGLDLDTPQRLFYVAIGFLCVGLVVYQAITYSVIGRSLIACRDDEIAARSSGLSTWRLRSFVFAVGAVYSSCGGSLLAHYYTAITPDLASMNETLTVLVIAVIGGMGSAAGAVFGSTIVNLLPEAFRGIGDYRMLAYGVILLAVILFRPQGMFSVGDRLAGAA